MTKRTTPDYLVKEKEKLLDLREQEKELKNVANILMEDYLNKCKIYVNKGKHIDTFQCAMIAARMVLDEKYPGVLLMPHSLEKVRSWKQMNELITTLHSIATKCFISDHAFSLMRQYVYNYTFSSCLFSVFILVINSSASQSAQISIKKFTWILFLYLKAQLLHGELLIVPALALLLAVLSVLARPLGCQMSTPIFTKISEAHFLPDSSIIESAIKFVEHALEDLVRHQLLIPIVPISNISEIGNLITSEKVISNNTERLIEKYDALFSTSFINMILK